MYFRNRTEAGRQLAERLRAYADRDDVVVVGIPRGGVVVAYEVAKALRAPLDVLVLRKLGVPWEKELAFGAIASGHIRVLNTAVIEAMGLSDADIQRVTEAEKKELARREQVYRQGWPALDAEGLTVILVDDAIATGASMNSGIAALREMKAARIVVGVPVAARYTCDRLRGEVDELVCVREPEDFYAAGQFYDDFTPVSDAEVVDLLGRATRSGMRRAVLKA